VINNQLLKQRPGFFFWAKRGAEIILKKNEKKLHIS
jgi:hypothetical protein